MYGVGTSNYNNLVVGILGKRGQGKTTLMKHFLALELRKNRDVLMFFPNDYNHYSKNLYRLIISGEFKLDDVPAYLKSYMMKNNRELSIFIDELDMFNERDENIAFIFNFSRNFKTNIFYVAKRTANISKKAVSQTDKFYVFKHTELNDLKRLRQINEKLFELAPKLQILSCIEIEDNDIKHLVKFKINFERLENEINYRLEKLEKLVI